MPIAPPPVDSERYIRAECSTITHSSLPPCPALQSPIQHTYLADMKLSGFLILLVILYLLAGSVDGVSRCGAGQEEIYNCIFGKTIACHYICVDRSTTTAAATTTTVPETTLYHVRNVL